MDTMLAARTLHVLADEECSERLKCVRRHHSKQWLHHPCFALREHEKEAEDTRLNVLRLSLLQQGNQVLQALHLHLHMLGC